MRSTTTDGEPSSLPRSPRSGGSSTRTRTASSRGSKDARSPCVDAPPSPAFTAEHRRASAGAASTATRRPATIASGNRQSNRRPTHDLPLLRLRQRLRPHPSRRPLPPRVLRLRGGLPRPHLRRVGPHPMNRVLPPTSYIDRRGEQRVVTVDASTWPFPRAKYEDGSWWEELPPSDAWLNLGWVQRPTTRWGWIRFHLLNGLLNGFPLLDVLVFAWRNHR